MENIRRIKPSAMSRTNAVASVQVEQMRIPRPMSSAFMSEIPRIFEQRRLVVRALEVRQTVSVRQVAVALNAVHVRRRVHKTRTVQVVGGA